MKLPTDSAEDPFVKKSFLICRSRAVLRGAVASAGTFRSALKRPRDVFADHHPIKGGLIASPVSIHKHKVSRVHPITMLVDSSNTEAAPNETAVVGGPAR
jgi:hypothetical protein